MTPLEYNRAALTVRLFLDMSVMTINQGDLMRFVMPVTGVAVAVLFSPVISPLVPSAAAAPQAELVGPIVRLAARKAVKRLPAFIKLARKPTQATNRRVVVDVSDQCSRGVIKYGGFVTNNTTHAVVVEAYVSINGRVQTNSWARLGRPEVKGAYLTIPAGYMVNLSTSFNTGNVIVVISAGEALLRQSVIRTARCAPAVRPPLLCQPSPRTIPRRPLPYMAVVGSKSVINDGYAPQGRSR